MMPTSRVTPRNPTVSRVVEMLGPDTVVLLSAASTAANGSANPASGIRSVSVK